MEIECSPCESETGQTLEILRCINYRHQETESYGRHIACFGDVKDTRESKFSLPALKKYDLDINDSKGSHITT